MEGLSRPWTAGFVVLAVFLLAQAFTVEAHSVRTERKQRSENDDTWMHPSGKNRQAQGKPHIHIAENEGKDFWYNDAQAKLQQKIKQQNIEKEAKNTILFLGDGMSIPTVTASRIFKGQSEHLPNGGEEAQLHFDNFPHTALSKTYCTDSQVADSACSATAYLCGVKANIDTIGVTNTVLLQDCAAQQVKANHVSSILAWAQAAGKSTGIVTTARITHASPAGTYAHVAFRDWENDAMIVLDGLDPSTCDDIAEQLILQEPGNKINVILGGGRRNFIPITRTDEEGKLGMRLDGKNLIETWQKDRPKAKYITSVDELAAIDVAETDYLLGLFAADHIAYNDSQLADKDPSLAAMTRKAIEILSKNPNGYYLFVEGGRIDHAHHETWAQRAFVETIEFDKAITLADELTDDQDTLIVVTSDHAHVMTINGYPVRGNPLLELSGSDGDDDIPYPTISYANGPGFKEAEYDPATGKCNRYDVTNDAFNDITYRQITMAPIDSETHGGDDVGIFAKGPWAHLFSGVVQQSYIPHAMAYAACIGNGEKFCDGNSAGTNLNASVFHAVFIFFVTLLFR